MEWLTEHDEVTGEEYIAVDTRGEALLRDPLTNKGTAFTEGERADLGLDGLLPAAVSTMDQQLARVYENYRIKPTPLERYIHLASLQDRNETLFFRLLHDHIDEMMPVVYTPVVGEACQQFSHIFRRPRGLYISYEQRHQIDTILRNHARPPAVIVVTDGERILGLGDQGVGGMSIPTGKLSLYTACAGIPPSLTLPIMLDVGTDNRERLNDPLYLGLRHQRIRGREYQDFIDRFVDAVMRVYPDAVLQWEDFLKANAITQLARFRDRLCTFNDDIQGTAAVAAAGVYASLRMTGQEMRDQRIVLAGAGASAQGIAHLFASALREAGVSHAEVRMRICTVDSRGLVTQARPDLEDFKAAYARPVEEVATYAVPRSRTHYARGNRPQFQAHDPHRHVGRGGLVHGSRGPRNGRPERPSDRVSLVEPDEQERVHGRAGDSVVRWSRDRRDRQPVRPGHPSRSDAPRRPGEQRVRVSRRRTGSVGGRCPTRHRRHVPRCRPGPGADGEPG